MTALWCAQQTNAKIAYNTLAAVTPSAETAPPFICSLRSTPSIEHVCVERTLKTNVLYSYLVVH